MTIEAERDIDAERAFRRRWWTLGVLCLSLVLISVANTSLNVGLPTLARDLGAGGSQLQWIVDAYSLVFACLLLTAGSLGDRFGRRAALNTGLVIFAAASAAAASSTSTTQLIAARAVMGAGAALVMPGTLSILAHVFPKGERAKAVSIWAGFAGAGGAGGTLTSGWLLQHFWWGSIFLSNVVVASIALVAGFFLVPRGGSERGAPLDPVGVLLSIAGLGLLVYAVIEAPGTGWLAPRTTCAVVAAVVLLTGFILWERRHPSPMLDMGLFRNARFTAATSTMTLIFFSMYGMVFLLTQYLQLVLGYDPLQAGLRVLVVPVVFMACAPLSANLVVRWGQRRVVVAGLVLLGTGMTVLSLAVTQGTYGMLFLALAVAALGMGLTSAPSTTAIMTSLPLDKAGVGSAVNDTTRELGGALGVAVLGSILASRFQHNVHPAVDAVSPAGSATPHGLSAALDIARQLPTDAGAGLAAAARHAYVNAFHVTLLMAAGVTLTAAVVVGYVLKAAAAEVTAPPVMPPRSRSMRVPPGTPGATQ